MSRLSSELLASIRAHQYATDEPTPPALTLPKGVTFNARLQRYYAKHDGRFIGAFVSLDDATKAAGGALTGLALLEAMQR